MWIIPVSGQTFLSPLLLSPLSWLRRQHIPLSAPPVDANSKPRAPNFFNPSTCSKIPPLDLLPSSSATTDYSKSQHNKHQEPSTSSSQQIELAVDYGLRRVQRRWIQPTAAAPTPPSLERNHKITRPPPPAKADRPAVPWILHGSRRSHSSTVAASLRAPLPRGAHG
jgi:hypothetical protein